ncbi:MAG: DUF4349 domain-containing protein [Bacteroidetes bacterium]|nr:DUF4349 domain-containing protein [Bacteroidota bacterium]
MKTLNYLLILVLLISFSCSNSSKSEFSDELISMDTEAEIAPVTRQAGAEVAKSVSSEQVFYEQDKKIIKDARVGLKVENYDSYRLTLDSAINSLNGYISNDNLDKNDFNIQCNLSIRMQAENFEKFLRYLENGDAKLLYKNVSARDVTEEFIDIEARLKTKKEVEKRYIQLLSRAHSIKDILAIEEKLRVIREEIEAKEGRLKYLRNQVAYSTIYLQITQELEYKYKPVKEKSFFQRLWKSIDKGWKGFIVFLLFLFRIWPVILIGLAIFYYIRRIRRKKRKTTKK